MCQNIWMSRRSWISAENHSSFDVVTDKIKNRFKPFAEGALTGVSGKWLEFFEKANGLDFFEKGLTSPMIM